MALRDSLRCTATLVVEDLRAGFFVLELLGDVGATWGIPRALQEWFAMFACHLDMVFLFLLVPRRPLVLLCVRYVGQNIAPKC